ncbi:MAG TPA: hypothetical protein VES67_04545 [Vicinamibacterales bacterium]|nr:hypothetical protein [Vicinamibacterales bacterium]
MAWLDEPGFERRPLVFVEDHLYHTAELLAAVAAVRPELIACTTAVGIDRPGPDTDATIAEWRTRHPALQIVAPLGGHGDETSASPFVRVLEPADTADAAAFARLVARLLRPGGVLIQDVQLSTLPFVPAERWWESIYVAATVRGMFPARPPIVRFLSNKRGYSATFGRDLLDAGFDPREVMDKSALRDVVVPTVASLFDRAFSKVLDARLPPGRKTSWPIGESDVDRREIEDVLDLVLWSSGSGLELGGRIVSGSAGRITFRTASPEADTWKHLLEDALAEGTGLPVVDVGSRIGPASAERAELTNLAARHFHTLRGRLRSADAIATVNHAYRLNDTLRVGSIRPSPHLR